MPPSSRPLRKRREPSPFPPEGEVQQFGSVDGKRYAGTVLGSEHAFGEEAELFGVEHAPDEWE
jgi:hypothetical protein